ncbi:MAG: GIY-YIG nuclease family protein [Patescibacteria group bacterium]
MAFVYILQDATTGKFYTGSCLELSKRVRRHILHTGGTTTSHGDWGLVCSKEFSTISEARKVEKLLKSYKGGNSFKKVLEEWKRD